MGLTSLVQSPDFLEEALKEEYRKAGIGTLTVKRILFEEMMKVLRPIRERAEELKKDPDYVMDALLEGARRARAGGSPPGGNLCLRRAM